MLTDRRGIMDAAEVAEAVLAVSRTQANKALTRRRFMIQAFLQYPITVAAAAVSLFLGKKQRPQGHSKRSDHPATTA
jgi:hypothetical protein